MEIIEKLDQNRPKALMIAVAFVVAATLLFQYLRSAPQMGPSDDVSKTVDALFTAMTSKDLQRLSNCEMLLKTYEEEGDLSPSAAARLDQLIQQARAGAWEASARKLYDFILAQRRHD